MMNRKYLAFDFETAKILPEDFGDLLAHRPLGICCAATWAADEDAPGIFYSVGPDGKPAAQMSQEDVSTLINVLLAHVQKGYTILTVNGLGVDFDVLAEESNRLEDCRQLAQHHVDMLFHIFCGKGFGVGLNATANAIGLSKPVDVDGSVAPQLWKIGEYRRVLDYVAQDCQLTLAIAKSSETHRAFRWITRKGSPASFDLPLSWLTVQEAMKLPPPPPPGWIIHGLDLNSRVGWVNLNSGPSGISLSHVPHGEAPRSLPCGIPSVPLRVGLIKNLTHPYPQASGTDPSSDSGGHKNEYQLWQRIQNPECLIHPQVSR